MPLGETLNKLRFFSVSAGFCIYFVQRVFYLGLSFGDRRGKARAEAIDCAAKNDVKIPPDAVKFPGKINRISRRQVMKDENDSFNVFYIGFRFNRSGAKESVGQRI
jgi:hypothetical protein